MKYETRKKLTNSMNPHVKLFLLLDAHDWYFNYSDDSRVYRKGQSERSAIIHFIKRHPETVGMHDHYQDCRVDDSNSFDPEAYFNIDYEIKIANVEVF